MTNEVIFTLGFIIGVLLGGMVGMFLMICFIGNKDE